jgi:hypothetical protein
MRRTTMLAGALAALAVPVAASAEDGTPTSTDRQNAAQECRFERGTTDATREAFRVKYGTNKNGKNAFGKCVSRHARDEAAEGDAAKSNAAKDCKAEREADADAFAETYGANKNGKNAYGKCVSQKAHEREQAADAKDQATAQARKSAAKTCDEERGETAESRAAFDGRYGTNRNKANAFGKCVSKTAKAQQEAQG